MYMDFNLDKKTKRLYIIKLVSDHSITAITRPCQGLDSSSILDGRSNLKNMFKSWFGVNYDKKIIHINFINIL